MGTRSARPSLLNTCCDAKLKRPVHNRGIDAKRCRDASSPASFDASPEERRPSLRYDCIWSVHSATFAGFGMKVTPAASTFVCTPSTVSGLAHSSLWGAAAPAPNSMSTNLHANANEQIRCAALLNSLCEDFHGVIGNFLIFNREEVINEAAYRHVKDPPSQGFQQLS